MASKKVTKIVKSIIALNIVDFADLADLVGGLFSQNTVGACDIDELREFQPVQKERESKIVEIIGCCQLSTDPHVSRGGRSYVQLVKLVREFTGFGLRDSKELVDNLELYGMPIKFKVNNKASRAEAIAAIQSFGYIVA